MAWLIVSNDNENGPAMRADSALMDAMWQWELSHRKIILTAGSLREDDGVSKNGSILILDVETREEARAVFDSDPATRAGMRGKTEIRYLNVAILNGIEQP